MGTYNLQVEQLNEDSEATTTLVPMYEWTNVF